jgi:hypothetical protein
MSRKIPYYFGAGHFFVVSFILILLLINSGLLNRCRNVFPRGEGKLTWPSPAGKERSGIPVRVHGMVRGFNMFKFKYDWPDCDEDPPQVYIVDSNGYEVLHVYEDPIFIGGELDEDTSWKLGPFAESVLRAINVADSAGSIIHETNS